MPEQVFGELIRIMERLRGPDGCPWDREQSLGDLARYIREEAAEVEQAVQGGAPQEIADELGDLLFNIVFAARIGEESGEFDLRRVLEGVRDKIVRRHPHVFGDERAETTEDVLRIWHRTKAEERRAAPDDEAGRDG